MANILTHPTNGAIYFDDSAAGSTTIPALTGDAVSLNYDGSAGLNITSYNTTSTDRFSIDGESGRLFSVNDSLTGTIFSVNDAAGLPVIEVESTSSTDTITMGTYASNALVVAGDRVGIGTASPSSSYKLDVVGSIQASSNIHANGNISATGNFESYGSFSITTIGAATSDLDKFLVSDGGTIKYRTGAQVLSDIGALSSETVTSLALTSGSLVYTDENGTDTSISLAAYLDEDSRSIASGSLNSSTGIVTFTRDDSTTFTLDLGPLLDDTNLVTSVAGKSGVVTLVKGDVGLGNVTNESKATMFTSPSFTGDVVITDDTFPFIKSSTNAVGAGIKFSDQTSGYTQQGTLTFRHSDSQSYGSGASFEFATTEGTCTILADGKLMYGEGIYSKPASGTGAGTRKDSNWDTAYSHVSTTNNPHSVTASQVGAYTSGQTDTLLAGKSPTAGSTSLTTAGVLTVDQLNMRDAGDYITFYGDDSAYHAIGARNSAAGAADDIRINSYGAVYVNLDSNSNNGGGANFQIGRHGGQINSGTISDWLFTVDGENGNVGIGTTSPSHKLEVGLTSSVALANQPAEPLFVSNDGNSVDGRVFISVKHDAVNTASAVGAGFKMTAAAVTSGTASYDDSLIFLRSAGTSNVTVHSAPRNIQFYVDNHDTNAGSGANYNDLGDLALTIGEDTNATFAGKITSGNDIVNATAGVYTWVGDTDTYIQRSAGNEITIKTGASNALVLDSSQNATFGGNIIASGAVYPATNAAASLGLSNKQWAGLDLSSSSAITWGNGDAEIIEGETNNYSLTFKTYDGSSNSAALRLDGDNTATFTGSIIVSGTVDGRDVAADGTKLDGISAGANNYSHPTHAGDDISIDTGALTGATVISDLDFNITTNTLGHVTDANGTVSTRTLTAANLGISAPNAPTSVSASIVGETIDLTFNASSTSNIDAYLVYSSVDGSDYGLIQIIPPDDFSATMSVIDSAFTVTGTQAYRVYAMKYGILSSAGTASVSYTVSSAEPTDMSVVNLNNAYFVQWNPPSANERFVSAYNVYKHEAATSGSLLRSSASLIYSGLNTNFMYQISGNNNSNYHQFWVETTIA
jgi:hypothetical protein